MKQNIFLAGSMLCAAVNISPAATGDWPQWRGTNRDGVSTETGLLNGQGVLLCHNVKQSH